MTRNEHRHRELAQAALDQRLAQQGEIAHAKHCSSDYERGFVDGYADYLDMGGCGELPPVPSRHYWNDKYFTPQHHCEMAEWYAGFRDGVMAAWGSGQRQFETVPSPLCCCNTGRPPCLMGAAVPPTEVVPHPAPQPAAVGVKKSGLEQTTYPGSLQPEDSLRNKK